MNRNNSLHMIKRIRIQVHDLNRFPFPDHFMIQRDDIALAFALFIEHSPGHQFARNDCLGSRIAALHLRGIRAIRLLHCNQLVDTAEHRRRRTCNQLLTDAIGIKPRSFIDLHISHLLLIQRIRSDQLDIRLSGFIECLAQLLVAAGKVTAVNAGRLHALVRVIRIFRDQPVIKLDQIRETGFKDIVGIQQQ